MPLVNILRDKTASAFAISQLDVLVIKSTTRADAAPKPKHIKCTSLICLCDYVYSFVVFIKKRSNQSRRFFRVPETSFWRVQMGNSFQIIASAALPSLRRYPRYSLWLVKFTPQLPWAKSISWWKKWSSRWMLFYQLNNW